LDVYLQLCIVDYAFLGLDRVTWLLCVCLILKYTIPQPGVEDGMSDETKLT
jgi:hypothetical protein